MIKDRALETRTNEARTEYHMEYANPLTVPPEVYDPTKWFHYAPADICGSPVNRFEQLLEQGWEAVKKIKREGGIDIDPLNRNPYKGLYSNKGSILVSHDKKVIEERQKRYVKTNHKIINSLEGVSYDVSDRGRSINGF